MTQDEIHSEAGREKIKQIPIQRPGSVEEIAKKRNLKPTTIFSHLANAYNNGRDINIFELVTKQEIDKVVEAVKEKGLDDGIKIIYEHLGQKVDYGKIRLALVYYEKNM